MLLPSFFLRSRIASFLSWQSLGIIALALGNAASGFSLSDLVSAPPPFGKRCTAPTFCHGL
jgi:hypothetical protein